MFFWEIRAGLSQVFFFFPYSLSISGVFIRLTLVEGFEYGGWEIGQCVNGDGSLAAA